MARKSARAKIDENLAKQDEGLSWYFSVLPDVLDGVYTASPALAYCFQLIESGQRIGLYALIMREYRTDSELTWSAVDRIDITRKNFPVLFQRISGKKLGMAGRELIKPAESVRDAIMHGRDKTEVEIQEAILKCLEYAEYLNAEFFAKAGFRPFGKLQGVTGKKGIPQLPRKISQLVLDGLLQKIAPEKSPAE